MLELRREELEWRRIDDEIVALDGRRSEYLGVEGSGVALWCALEQGATRAQLVAMLVDRYGIATERAATDVESFLAELAGRELLAP